MVASFTRVRVRETVPDRVLETAEIEVVAVRRIYLTPEAWDTEGKVEDVEEVARLCFPCQTSYPH